MYFLTETPNVYAIPYGSFLYSNKTSPSFEKPITSRD
jgi:hypothetical protein